MKRMFQILLLLVVLVPYAALADPVDLSTFTADDGIAQDNGVINFTENGLSAIFFYNGSFDVPVNASTLSFDYALNLGGESSRDYLVAVIDFYDYGMSVGNSGQGSCTINLQAYRGEHIDLAFGLESDLDDDKNLITTAQISNVTMNTAAVPEPSTLLLFGIGSGLTALFSRLRMKS